ncbi:ParB/RepB/Spo0J family partition protein [Anaerovorax odorimutans]|uniref:ParB/RepB/Spo0J family partition protein n=1 Tax=Anaerovorax odorimutans TaxID=109327 RepID=UPI0003FDBD00|nr:ParB/RepB/Spo0J family partition protein [Anaerovorax odorimutans]
MAGAKGRGLGKGLEALFNNVEISTKDIEESTTDTIEGGSIMLLDINDIKPNENQPRKNFTEEKINDLAKSIEAHGIIQPIMVKPSNKGYEIVAGERRWRAARKALLKKVPCVVRNLTEEQNMLIAIIENMQREDLNPIEEAEALNQMISTYGLTQEEVSKSVGKSRPYITNSIRLLKLPNKIQNYVINGSLTNGHARALIVIKDEKKQLELAEKAVKEGLSVREIEILSGEIVEGRKPKPKARPRVKNKEILDIEGQLKTLFGTKVAINHKGKNGRIELEYYNKEELDRLIEILLSLSNVGKHI